MASIYEHVTRAIVEQLDKGVVPWIRPWKEDAKAGSAWGLPYNVAKGREYRGANVPLLWGLRQSAGYTSDAWLTLKQANALGGRVLKGERPSWVHYYLWKENEKRERYPILRAYRVFNVDQTEGCDLPQRSAVQELGEGSIEDRVRALGARVRLGGNRAYFDVGADRIAVPLPDKFASRDAFRATLAHELTHWTGHAPRLNRPIANHFGTPEYAREELVAELGSAFVCARLGISLEGLQHPEYLGSWLKVLKEDSRAIMRAASAAQRACDLIMGDPRPEDREPKPEEASEEPASEAQSVPAVAPEADPDTQALAAQYIVDAARKLYCAGHADALDPEMAERVAKVQRKARSRRGQTVVAPGRWERHPVTGHSMFVREGLEIADLIPFGHDPKALAQVRTEWSRHGRIGAANLLVSLAREGLADDAKSYRKGMQSRRSEACEGAVRYSYGPGSIDVAKVLEAVQIRDDGSTRAIALR